MHSSLIQKIRDKHHEWTALNYEIHLGWIRTYTGIEGNEPADQLTKATAGDDKLEAINKKIPTTTILSDFKKKSLEKMAEEMEGNHERSGMHPSSPE
ncbi:hypothetical protein ANN_04015 [Periplaneta americana]|uniref:RNase H type-1 domain-containing protein n=1 Tax=Periplaneta americana TaxID=6978 RepID=A0ABQ8T8V3_PERAM|nr:hypothetical protein ANN_04015 [Periplaneta americana]